MCSSFSSRGIGAGYSWTTPQSWGYSSTLPVLVQQRIGGMSIFSKRDFGRNIANKTSLPNQKIKEQKKILVVMSVP